MTEPIAFTAVYESVEDGWVEARLVEWPAVVTCGPTIDEAREMLSDALREMVLSYTDQDRTPPPVDPSVTSKRLQITIA